MKKDPGALLPMAEQHTRSTTLLAVSLAIVGTALLATLFLIQTLPDPLWLWATLTLAFVLLEYAAVEVGDRLLVSASAMVAFTAAVVFGRESAILAVALMTAVTVLDLRQLANGQWRRLLANLGQMVISASVAIGMFALALPAGAVARGDILRVVAGAAAAAVLYDWINYRLVAFATRWFYPERRPAPWAHFYINHFAFSVLGVLGVLLGVAYVLAGSVILPLLLITYLIGHFGFSTYSQLREAHHSTIRGFAKAVEALDPYTRGHTERVAHFVEITGLRLGLGPAALERLRWAALIQDVGKVAVPPDLLRKPDLLTPDEERRVARYMRVVQDLLAEVEFLKPMVEVVRGRDQTGAEASPEARLLAAADAFDSITSTRSYRAAVTQAEAFAELRRRADLYGEDVVAALEQAITERGEVYGSPDDASSAEVERLVKERSIRA